MCIQFFMCLKDRTMKKKKVKEHILGVILNPKNRKIKEQSISIEHRKSFTEHQITLDLRIFLHFLQSYFYDLDVKIIFTHQRIK